MTHVPQGENAPYNEHYHFFHGLNCGFAFIPTLLHTHTCTHAHTPRHTPMDTPMHTQTQREKYNQQCLLHS